MQNEQDYRDVLFYFSVTHKIKAYSQTSRYNQVLVLHDETVVATGTMPSGQVVLERFNLNDLIKTITAPIKKKAHDLTQIILGGKPVLAVSYP